jgi:hypothetical protein
MTREQAKVELVNFLAEAIVYGKVPIHYLTGDEGNKPDPVQQKLLADALNAMGGEFFKKAAKVVREAV